MENRPRLLVVTLTNMEDKMEILRSAASLRETTWDRVYITPDLTWQEREKGRQLRSELARRKEAGEVNIGIRHGKIVQVPNQKRSQTHQTQSAHGAQLQQQGTVSQGYSASLAASTGSSAPPSTQIGPNTSSVSGGSEGVPRPPGLSEQGVDVADSNPAAQG